MEEPFITYDVYYKICKKFSITDKNEQETLLNYLNALGIVLHFEVLKAFNTQVLNPLWLTQAVYRVINSSIISGNKGVFAEKELFAILNDEKYKEIENAEDNNLFEKLIKWFARNKTNKRSRIIDYKNKSTLPFIAKVMQQFELSYSLDENRYIIPDLLPVEPSHPINYKEYDLHIAVDFYFLPPALMPRFMVQTHQHIKDAIRWRTGVMLNAESNYDATGVVSIDKDSKRLHIYVKGNQKRELLTYTRSVLKGLYNSYEGLKEPGRVVEKLFLPERPDIEVKLSEIEGLEEMGEKEYSNGIAQKKFNISSLLGGIQNPDYVINKDEKALKVFISYSRSKSKFREELVTMIHPLVNFKNNFLEAWHDEEILPGEDWKKEIDKALMKSDLVICLISAEYLKSEWCMYELQRANELNKIIYAILINHCGWEDHKTLKAQRPKNWMEIYQEINKLVTKNK
jgi:internalin A